MPKLKDTEWEMLENEISIISFLQGINLGGKIYNGYTVVTNDKTEEVVKEERIYINTNDGYYHKINDKHFQDSSFDPDTVSAGVLDLDFEIRKDGATGVSYTKKDGLGCYTSIVGQENVDNTYDSIYEYLEKTNEVDDKIKQIYYTALGRERWGTYKIENPSLIPTILNNMQPGNPSEGGEVEPPAVGTISVDIVDSDFKYSYEIDATGSVELKKAITFTLPNPSTGYKVKYAYVKSTDISSIDYIWDNNSTVAWTDYGVSGEIFTRVISEEGMWFLCAKVEGPSGETLASTYNTYLVQKQVIDTIAPEIEINNLDGRTDRNYTVGETIRERIEVTNEIGGTNLNPNKFLYIFTQSASLPSESDAGWKNYGGSGAIITHELTTSGTWYLYVKAADIANPANEKIETRTNIVRNETGTVSINITDTDGIAKIYNIPRNRTIDFEKQITITASSGNVNNLIIQYDFVKATSESQGTPTWSAYTTGTTIRKTVSYMQHGYYYLHIRVLDTNGNVVATKVQQYVFNGAIAYM